MDVGEEFVDQFSSLPFEDFLMHYGVKGMKWGVRRDEAMLARMAGGKLADETKEEKAAYKAYKKSTSGKQRRADRQEATQMKVDMLVNASLKKPTQLIEVGTPGYKTVMTGQEFMNHMLKGGYFDVVTTNVLPAEIKRG